jgi:hypothetical protein
MYSISSTTFATDRSRTRCPIMVWGYTQNMHWNGHPLLVAIVTIGKRAFGLK